MSYQARYVFVASMDVQPDKEAVFNEVYDTEHVPLLRTVPGVVSVARLAVEPLTMVIGGERRTISAHGEPHYGAAYEIESPEVLVSDAWGAAIDRGRWPGEVRPYTTNRRHVLYRVLEGR